MGFMDLTCRESISLINGVRCCAYKSNILYLGWNYQICLFFEIPPAAYFSRINNARLILFKIPLNYAQIPFMPQISQFCICPLSDFFSSYSNWYTPPGIVDRMCEPFEDRAWIGYTEIDVTAIARAWIEGKAENKGLILAGAWGAWPLAYASDIYETFGMRPMLRLNFEGITQPLSAAACTVEVQKG